MKPSAAVAVEVAVAAAAAAAASRDAGQRQAHRDRNDQRLLGLPPLWSPDARLLLLGSFPGATSLAAQQYYAHPRNLFWPLVGELIGVPRLAALAYPKRLDMLRAHRIALWDVHAACRRQGSLDSAIEAAEPNDLPALVVQMPQLVGIGHNGGESARAMRLTAALGPRVWRLPSTSPANASQRFEHKRAAWQIVFEACGIRRSDEAMKRPGPETAKR